MSISYLKRIRNAIEAVESGAETRTATTTGAGSANAAELHAPNGGTDIAIMIDNDDGGADLRVQVSNDGETWYSRNDLDENIAGGETVAFTADSATEWVRAFVLDDDTVNNIEIAVKGL